MYIPSNVNEVFRQIFFLFQYSFEYDALAYVIRQTSSVQYILDSCNARGIIVGRTLQNELDFVAVGNRIV